MLGAKSIKAIAAVAIVWKLIGVATYLAHVGLLGEGGPPPGGREMPPLITAAYATGVFVGLGSAVGLFLLRRWARLAAWVALVALVIDWGWVFGFSGAASVPIGVTVLFVASLMVYLAEVAKRSDLLR